MTGHDILLHQFLLVGMNPGLTSPVSDQQSQQQQSWLGSIPHSVGCASDITGEAVWNLSSCKEGLGIHQLLDDRQDTYWQSDGLQPHIATIEFQRKTSVNFLVMHLDYKLDESYTPSKIQVQIGDSVLDLDEVKTVSFSEPNGWQLIDLRHPETKKPARAFVIVIQITQNHQNGRDTHIRGLRVLGPSNPHKNINGRALATNPALARHFDEHDHPNRARTALTQFVIR